MHEPQGILEEYRGGLLEVRPDEDDVDWWRATALYMSDGEVFERAPALVQHTGCSARGGQKTC